MTIEEQNPKGITRRDFLKGAAVGAGAVATTGLIASCSPKVATPAPTEQPAASGKASFEVPPEPIAQADIIETTSADVVVIGAGVSGLMAALSAAEAGAKTVLIEKSESFNARGGHNAAIRSKIQLDEGLDYKPT